MERGEVNSTEKSLEDLTLRLFFIDWIFAMRCDVARYQSINDDDCWGLSCWSESSSSAEFSFLLGLITLTAAAGYKCLTKWEAMNQYLTLGPVILGCLVAGVFAGLSVFWLVGYLTRKGLGVFVV